MFEEVNFPQDWFYIKSHQNGYVLSIEDSSHASGTPIVLSGLRTKDMDGQLWRIDGHGRLVNKKTNQVMGVANGKVKVGTDVVQQVASSVSDDPHQAFALSKQGHIYLKSHGQFVLGIKESFFSRREGLHVHLQLAEAKHLDRKEQRWELAIAMAREPSTTTVQRSSSSVTTGTLDDTRSVASSLDDEGARSVVTGTFPNGEFFLKSVSSGLYIGPDQAEGSGSRLVLDNFRKSLYDSQLWTHDEATGALINKRSGLLLSVDAPNGPLKDDAHVSQLPPSPSTHHQEWVWSKTGQLYLKHDPSWVLGFKDSWFGLNREGAHLYLQKLNSKQQNLQTFQVVLPIFKKREVQKENSLGQFPEGWFFVKSQAHSLVLTVEDSGALAASVISMPLDTGNYSRQLWKFKDGYLINKASEMVLDIKGGAIATGAELCQYNKKKRDNDNQQWGLYGDGSIFVKHKNSLVLTVQENETKFSKVYLGDRLVNATRTVTKTVVKKAVIHRYAQYPRGWFFIRYFAPGDSMDSPMVLAAQGDRQILLAGLDRKEWANQLWTYSQGSLINYGTQLVLNVDDLKVGAAAVQAKHQLKAKHQWWSLTIDGHLIQQGEPTLALTNKDGALVLTQVDEATQQAHRWGFVLPEFKYENRRQVLLSWKIANIKEWVHSGASIQKVTPSIAHWPEEAFYISAGDKALVPVKAESHSRLTLRTFSVKDHQLFQWIYKNGYLVHVATGLVLHAEALANGTALEIRAEKQGKNGRADDAQLWTIRTDGSIVSSSYDYLGLGGEKIVELYDLRKSRQHTAWTILSGHYEENVLVRFRRYILIIATQRTLVNRQLVVKKVGVFPKEWIFIHSKQDKNLVLTSVDTKKGSKLILAKMDFKNYKRQLWYPRDDQCLVNFASDFVIDVAGGQLFAGANVIQWNEKFLRRNRKNQMWGLTVDGHIHPDARSGLVLSPKKNAAKEAVELTLVARGALDRTEQQWSFSRPVFRSASGAVVNVGLTNKSSDLRVEETAAITLTSSDRQVYERTEKKTIVRRWGVFPEGDVFVRVGKDRLALTVESSPLADQVHLVTLKSLNFQDHKWQMWHYKDNHLINAQTGLALDVVSSDNLRSLEVEQGLQSPLCVRAVSMEDSQFFALGIHGEIHWQSNVRMVVSVANQDRVVANGAQIGIKAIKVNRSALGEGKEETTLASEDWMHWAFSRPVYSTVKSESSTEVASGAAAAAAVIAGGAVLESLEDEQLAVKEDDESADEASDSEDEEEDEDEDIVEEEQEAAESVAEQGEGVAEAMDESVTLEDIKNASAISLEMSHSIQSTDSGEEHEEVGGVLRKKEKRRWSRGVEKKSSFILPDGYVPTGFEKIVRFKGHQASFFPSGYFFIKSELHGLVLDVESQPIQDNSGVSLTRLRSSDFASQLWSYKDGFLVNLKGNKLVMDASAAAVTTAGERVHLSTRKENNATDQQWAWAVEGSLYLKLRRSLLLSVKELKASASHQSLPVYLMEQKAHPGSKYPRREQRWEIVVPSLIPTSGESSSSGTKLVFPTAAAATAVATAGLGALSFKWLSKLHRHQHVSGDLKQYQGKWFMISYGQDANLFLAAGADKSQPVSLSALSEDADHKRFLWTFVDGYLINYRYLLRLIYCQKTRRWLLADASTEADQTFAINERGVLTLRIKSILYYIWFTKRAGEEQEALALTENEEQAAQQWTWHTAALADGNATQEASDALTKASTWATEQKRTITTTTTTWTITRRRALFPTAALFFIKFKVDGQEYVLAHDEASNALVIQKISFVKFKHLLWTWRENRLVNYGSSLTIGFKDNKAVLVDAKDGYAWNLSVDGHIHTDEATGLFVFARSGSETIDNEQVHLVSASETLGKRALIQWSFSSPVFGKRAVAAGASAEAVEETIESVETVATIETEAPASDSHIAETVTAGLAVGAVAAADQFKDNKITTVTNVRETVRTWWLRVIRIVRTKKEQGESDADIAKYMDTEKTALYEHLDWSVKNHGDKKVSEELAVAVQQSKVLVGEQTTEVHGIIKGNDKQGAADKLDTLSKVTEEKIKVVVIAGEKKPEHEHHHVSAGEVVGGIAAAGAAVIAGGLALEHHKDKKEAEAKKSEAITKTTTTTTTWTITRRRALFPTAALFFIKFKVDGQEYVLAHDEASNALVIQKISFVKFKHLLWTWRENRLVNYGSSLTIGFKDNKAVLVDAKDGYAWNLSVDGHIHTDEATGLFVFARSGSETIDNEQVHLVSASETLGKRALIQWSFSSPVFGKRAGAAGASAEAVEETIESVETVTTIETEAPASDSHIAETVTAGLAVGAVAAADQFKDNKITTVTNVRETVRTWWLRVIRIVRTKKEQGESDADIAKYMDTEKTALYEHLDWSVKNHGDKKVSEELAVAVQQSKVLVGEQTTEVHGIIKGNDKQGAADKLDTLSKVTEEKIKVVVIAGEKKPEHEHHHVSAGEVVGGIAAAGAAVIAGGLALEHHKEKKEAEAAKKPEVIAEKTSTTIVTEVKEKPKAAVIVEEVKKSEVVVVGDAKKPEHEHHHVSAGEVVGGIAAAGAAVIAGGLALEHHKEKKEAEAAEKKEAETTALVSVGQVQDTVRVWWLRIIDSVRFKKEQGVPDEEIVTYIETEKTTLYGQLDKSAKNGDKKVAEELAVAIEQSKVLVGEQTIEVHGIISGSDKKSAADKLATLSKVTEEKIKVVVIADEKPKHHVSAGEIVGGIAAAGAAVIAGGLALEHHKEKKEAEAAKKPEVIAEKTSTAIVTEVKEKPKAAVIVEEVKKSEVVVVGDVKKPEHEHHHVSAGEVVGGIAAAGAAVIAGGLALEHHKEKKEAEAAKKPEVIAEKTSTVIVTEVKEKPKAAVIVEEVKKSEVVVVGDVKKPEHEHHVSAGEVVGGIAAAGAAVIAGGLALEHHKEKKEAEAAKKPEVIAEKTSTAIVTEVKEKPKAAVIVGDAKKPEHEHHHVSAGEVVGGIAAAGAAVIAGGLALEHHKEKKEAEAAKKPEVIAEKTSTAIVTEVKEKPKAAVIVEEVKKSEIVVVGDAKKPEHEHHHVSAGEVVGGIAAAGAAVIAGGLALEHHKEKKEAEAAKKPEVIAEKTSTAIVTEVKEKPKAAVIVEEVKKSEVVVVGDVKKPEHEHHHVSAGEVVGGIAAAGAAVIAGGLALEHHKEKKEAEAAKKPEVIAEKTSTTIVTEVKEKPKAAVIVEEVKKSEVVVVGDVKKPEHEHHHVSAGEVVGGIAAAGAAVIAGGLALEHHKEKKEAEAAEKKEAQTTALVSVGQVQDTVRVWWLRIIDSVRFKKEQGVPDEEIVTYIETEKTTLYGQLDKSAKNGDKKVAEELAVAIEQSKVLVGEQTIEVHGIISGSDKKSAADKLATLSKVTEEKIKVVVIADEKPKHHVSAGEIVGGIAAAGAAVIAGGLALEHHKEKKEAEAAKKPEVIAEKTSTTIVTEVKEKPKAAVIVEEVKKSEVVVVGDAKKPEHEHHHVSAGEVVGGIAAAGAAVIAGGLALEHHKEKKEAEAAKKPEVIAEKTSTTIVTEVKEKPKAAVIVEEVKKSEVVVVGDVKKPEHEHHVSAGEIVGGIAAAGAAVIAGGLALEHHKEKKEAEAAEKKEAETTALVSVGQVQDTVRVWWLRIIDVVRFKKEQGVPDEEIVSYIETEKTTLYGQLDKSAKNGDKKVAEELSVAIEQSKVLVGEQTTEVHGIISGNDKKSAADKLATLSKVTEEKIKVVVIADEKPKHHVSAGEIVGGIAAAGAAVIAGGLALEHHKEKKEAEAAKKPEVIAEKTSTAIVTEVKEKPKAAVIVEEVKKSEVVVVGDVKKPEHEHHVSTGEIVGGIAAAGAAVIAGGLALEHHKEKKEAEAAEKKEAETTALVSVGQVQDTVRVWWLRIIDVVRFKKEQGVPDEEIVSYIETEKTTLYGQLDKSAKNGDKKVAEELSVAIEQSKVLVGEQTTEMHGIISGSDKKSAADKLATLSKVTEEKIKVVVIADEKPKHHVSAGEIVGGIAAAGAAVIAGGLALEHHKEKKEAEAAKKPEVIAEKTSTTIVTEVKEKPKAAVIVEEVKKSEVVVVGDAKKPEHEHHHVSAGEVVGGIAVAGAAVIAGGLALEYHKEKKEAEAAKKPEVIAEKTSTTIVTEVKEKPKAAVIVEEVKKSEVVVVGDAKKPEHEHHHVSAGEVVGGIAVAGAAVIAGGLALEYHKEKKEAEAAKKPEVIAEKTSTTIVTEVKEKPKAAVIVEEVKKSEVVVVGDVKKPEHEHHHVSAGEVVGGIAAAGAAVIAGGLALEHHKEKKEAEVAEKKEAETTALVSVGQVQDTVRVWWLRIIDSVRFKKEQGVPDEEIVTYIETEKTALYGQLDKSAKNGDKKVAEELAVAIEQSKVLVGEQTTEMHGIISGSDKKSAADKLATLSKVTEEKIKVVVIADEKPKHHVSAGEIVGGIAVAGAAVIAGGLALEHHKEKKEAEAAKKPEVIAEKTSTTIVTEVKEKPKAAVIVEEVKKSEVVVVGDVKKPEHEHHHVSAGEVVGGIAAAGAAVIAGGLALEHHKEKKEAEVTEKKEAETTALVSVGQVQDTVRVWWLRIIDVVRFKKEQGVPDEEIVTYIETEKTALYGQLDKSAKNGDKKVAEELAVAIEQSKVLVGEQTTEMHGIISGSDKKSAADKLATLSKVTEEKIKVVVIADEKPKHHVSAGEIVGGIAAAGAAVIAGGLALEHHKEKKEAEAAKKPEVIAEKTSTTIVTEVKEKPKAAVIVEEVKKSEVVVVGDVKKPEHEHHHVSAGEVVGGIAAAGAAVIAGGLALEHHKEKKEAEVAEKKEAETTALVSVGQVQDTVRVWWLRIIDSVRFKKEQGVPDEEIVTYIETEKTALYGQLDKSAKNGDKKVAEELAVAIEQSKVLVGEQTTEVHGIISGSDKKSAADKLATLSKVTEEKIKVVVIADEKPKHHVSAGEIVGGIAVAGAAVIAGGLALEHHKEKKEAEAAKKPEVIAEKTSTTIVTEVKEKPKAAVIVEEVKKSEVVVVGDAKKPEHEHHHVSAGEVVGGIAAAGAAVIAGGLALEHHKEKKEAEAAEKKEAETTALVSVGQVQDTVRVWWLRIIDSVRFKKEQGVPDEEIVTYIETEKTTLYGQLDKSAKNGDKKVAEELAVAIEQSKVLVGEQTTEVHGIISGSDKKSAADKLATLSKVTEEKIKVVVIADEKPKHHVSAGEIVGGIAAAGAAVIAGGLALEHHKEKKEAEAAQKSEVIAEKTSTTIVTEVKEKPKQTLTVAEDLKVVGDVKKPVHHTIAGGIASSTTAVIGEAMTFKHVKDKKGSSTSGSEIAISTEEEVMDTVIGNVPSKKSDQIVTVLPIAASTDSGAVLEVVEKTRQESSAWYLRLIVRIKEIVSQGGADVKEKVDAAVSEADQELVFVLEKSKLEGKADVAKVDSVLTPIKLSLQEQLHAIKASNESKDHAKILAVCEAGQMSVDTTFKEATEKVTPKQDAKHEGLSDKAKAALGLGAVIAGGAAIAHHEHKKHEAEAAPKDETVIVVVEKVDDVKITEVNDKYHSWWLILIEKILARVNQGGEKVEEDVAALIAESQEKLKSDIGSVKTIVSTEDKPADDKQRGSFGDSLSWLVLLAGTQAGQIKSIVSQYAKSDKKNKADLEKQLNNVASISEVQANTVLVSHTHDHVQPVIVPVTTTKESLEIQTSKSLAPVVESQGVLIYGWFDVLFAKLKNLSANKSTIEEEDVRAIIVPAQTELDSIIVNAKKEVIQSTTFPIDQQSDISNAALVLNSQKQAADSFDGINTLIAAQLAAILALSKETNDTKEWNDRATWIVGRAKQHAEQSLQHTTESAVGVAFEGKAVTWVETAHVPETFGSVKTVVIDIVGTVLDLEGSLFRAWKAIADKKQGTLLKIDGAALVHDWYERFVAEKQKLVAKKQRAIQDAIVIRETLIAVLKHHKVDCLIQKEDIDALVRTWDRLDVFGDVVASVRQLKQKGHVFTVALSPVLSTRTMMSNARHNCLCWHSQISSDALTLNAEDDTLASAAVDTAKSLLAYDNADELALVSAHPLALQASQKLGAHTILVARDTSKPIDHSIAEVSYDGLDVLAESYQTFVEHEHASQKQPTRSWFQRVVDTASYYFE
ncbi:hypothetical protein DM01DRAFT_1372553 [Hesseltinella vesiculosa]|uniref:Ricin B lectin domain-containing protein n=1 Tax=Hesseltinella vesiculosa TaxID=101127 RepID=A0A1X2GMQ4_9FUNG|nr:hypothetical protein DM01DRAFT_1372553 [Hesseltinella vesiculosa]